ncbi:ankyrin repeat domain-containing protein [Aurantivibrio plasticivorans]
MSKWQVLSIETAERMIAEQNVIVLDMRDIRSYSMGHYPTALHLDDSNLRMLLKHTNKSLPIIIYCYHGHSSRDMAQLFSDFGFSCCYSLEGGYEAWFQALNPPMKKLSPELTNWLTSEGFNPENLDSRLSNNETALMVAARKGLYWVCNQLIDAGASVDLKNADGNNALWMACMFNDCELVKLFIMADIDVDNQNDNGATALIYAASKGNHEMINMLINCGANPSLTTLDGFSPLDVAGDLPTLRMIKNFVTNIQEGVIYPVSA